MTNLRLHLIEPSFVFADTLKDIVMVPLLPMLFGFGVTVISTWLICRLSKGISIGQDSAQGIQKFHINPTSRLGGISIFLGLAASGLAVPGDAEFQTLTVVFIPFSQTGLATRDFITA